MILDRALLRRVDSVAVSDSVILGPRTYQVVRQKRLSAAVFPHDLVKGPSRR
jgi:hypothetical protein